MAKKKDVEAEKFNAEEVNAEGVSRDELENSLPETEKSASEAKKVSSKSSGKATAESLGAAIQMETDPTKNENVKLNEEEKLAMDIQTKAAQGSTLSGKFKLKDPATSYNEPGFTLAEDQEKELPADPSPELIARIRAGFIVKA